jgi:hypothetical protein
LPGTKYTQIDLYGETAIIGTAQRVYLVNVGLPADPAALRAWLGTITNAKPIAGSEAYAWPSN